LVTVTLGEVTRYGRLDKKVQRESFKRKIAALTTKSDPIAHYMVFPHKKEGDVMLMVTPDRRIQESLLRHIPESSLDESVLPE